MIPLSQRTLIAPCALSTARSRNLTQLAARLFGKSGRRGKTAMKISMYFHYTSRSLLRGGQRTVLACFCVGVGVMALVALQLVGLMINSAMTTNVRDANGGDINVTTRPGSRAFTQDDLSYFDQLKHDRVIAGYTALTSLNGSFSTTLSADKSFSVHAVDPATFPVVSAPAFTQPAHGSLAPLLIGNGAIIDQKLADAHQKRI